MTTRSSLEEIFVIHRLDERDLNQLCSKEHREEFTKRIKNWKAVGDALGFTQEELDMIDSGFPSEEQKKTALLIQWSMRDKKEATYLNLAKLLFTGEQLDLLQVLCSIIAKATSTTPAESKDQYVEPRHQGALVLYQPEGQTSETKLSLQQSLKSETNGATSIRLNEKDIIDLMKLLQSYSYKWNPIGLNLGFTPHELSTISCMVALIVGAPVSHLQELLSQWVQWPTNEHPNNPTLKTLCSALRSPLVGLGSLAEDVEKEMKQCTTGVLLIDQYINDDNVADKIHQFEKQFKDLHKCIRMELVKKEGIDVKELLQSLTLLPTKLKNEYQKEILQKLPTLRKEESIPELFLHLNPLFSFLDYTLLEYIIEEFGSATLKQKMQSYSLKVRNFMDQITVRQLIDYWPCKEESAPKVSKMIAKIDKDPQLCKLSELDTLRKKICICVRLSDVICAVVSVSSSQSFVVAWRLPSVLAPDMIESLSEIDKNFFRIESIDLISIDDVQVYPRLAGAKEGVSQEPSTSVKQKHSLSLKKRHQSGKFASVRLDEDIQKYIVCGVPSGNELGKGSWGSVKEIEIDGLICVGKLFNESLFSNEIVAEVTFKYVNLCRILSNLRHPNIIQFLGLCFLQDHPLPMIVTEKMEGNLHSLLETVSNIPMMLKQSLLEDVARGLHYLHTFNPVITHGVLTARNVLYTSSLTAKITDISNTQMATFQSEQLNQTLSVPTETLSYLPSSSAYQSSPEQDIFSYGHLALFTFTQEFPMKLDGQHQLKIQYGRTSQSEIKHREQHIQHVERLLPNHSLTKMIKKCLHSDPKKRPTARQLLTTLEETKATTDKSIAKKNAARQVLAARDFADLEHRLKEALVQLDYKDRELQEIMQSKDREIKELVKSRDKKIQDLIEFKAREINELLESKDREIKELIELNDMKIKELSESKDREIKELSTNLKPKEMESEGISVQMQPAAAAEPDKQGGQPVPLLKSQDIVLTLLCGYYAIPREERTPEGYTHNWTAFVRGETREDGRDIMHVVNKVVFQLHKDFEPNATRVVREPPYEISVPGFGSFELPVKIYFSNHEKGKFEYDLRLYTCHVSTVLRDKFTFQKPSKNFREKLILAGGRPCQSLPTSQKRKSKKRTSKSDQPKSKKKIRLKTDSQEQPSSSWLELGEDKNTPTSSDSSSDDEWRPSQTGYDSNDQSQ